jgi:hypothetical protein
LNYELSVEQELDEADDVIYQPPPLHMSGLMKLDVNKVTRIASNSAVAMMIYCVNTTKLSNGSFLHLSTQARMLTTIPICNLFLMMAV